MPPIAAAFATSVRRCSGEILRDFSSPPGELCDSLSDFIDPALGARIDEDFPDTVRLAGATIPLRHRHAPGDSDDGVTLALTPEQLGWITPEWLDGLVPGWTEPRVHALLNQLPKDDRRALIPLAEHAGVAQAYLLSFMRGVWSEGIDAGSDRGLRRIAERAGLSWTDAQAALDDQAWRAIAEANRSEMFALGLWGVPSFRVGQTAVWGQDRLWAIQQAVQAGPSDTEALQVFAAP